MRLSGSPRRAPLGRTAPAPAYVLGGVLLAGALALGGCGERPAPGPPPDLAAVPAAAARDAITAATRAVEADPHDAARWAELGRLYEIDVLNLAAETCYVAAADLDRRDPRAPYRAAVVAAAAGEVERAVAHVTRTLALEPDYGPAWRRRGGWRLELGDVDGARADLERVVKLMPGAYDGPLVLARIALQADDVDAAVTQAEIAIARAPSDAYVRQILGTALRRAGRAEEAQPHLEAGQGSSPRYADPWSLEVQRERLADEELANRASQLEAAGEHVAAASEFRRLAARRPDDWAVALRLGISLAAAGEGAEALEVLDEAATRFPAQYDLVVARINALRASGDKLGALEAAGAVTARWPDRAPAYLVLGALLRDDGDDLGARRAFARAIRLDPSDLRGRMFLGQLHVRAQRWDQATTALLPGLEDPDAAPPLPYFQLLLGALVQGGGDRAVVEGVYRRALHVHGDAASALLSRR